MSEEQWLPIPGFVGQYEVSNRGRVRSFVSTRGLPIPHVLKPYPKGPKGHLMVGLCAFGKRRPMLVHRAVLAAFVGPAPTETPITRHLDGNPGNNHLSNLRYGTYSENEFDKVRHGTHQQASKTHCKRGHPFTDANTRRRAGGRWCIACERVRNGRRGEA